ncbi:MAG: Lauroyl/myristoyl acyltransferase/Phosphopantetheinyl transferase (holo-ACP synthase) [Verrucomicrobia bacterium]|jgi:KDO2-lipid IV(A) lauroyltransferase|nr:MAG: Lauroyl/myristoyl acyltransferase/Phosphopantetheinyl transferase (holo-ACP synthase) [Verrucomicrobiota bacterium]
MTPEPPPGTRCGIDTVEIPRLEKLLRATAPEDLGKLFTQQELADAGDGAGRTGSLAARFAAKEACCKLFPRETALGHLGPADFSVRSDGYGAPHVEVSPAARAAMNRAFVSEIRLSLTHTTHSASAVAVAEKRKFRPPWFGRLVYHLLPLRRGVVLKNMRRAFAEVLDEAEVVLLAQCYYGHFVRCLMEFFLRKRTIRIEGMETASAALAQGKGMLLLTGHFGNWEVATVDGIRQFTEFKGLFHFVRKPLKPEFFNRFVTWRFRRAGFGTIPSRGSLDAILDLLGQGQIVVFIYDQHATQRDGVPADFLGSPANTFRSLPIIAMSTGAPVVPATSWREPDGTHVLRFEEPVPVIDHEKTEDAVRLTATAFNKALEDALLRHPDQWIWMHQRWKEIFQPKRKRKRTSKVQKTA